MVNFLIFILYFFFILIAIFGYGNLFKNFSKEINKKEVCFGYLGLNGTVIILIYSYISNFFFSHSKYHNFLFLLFGVFIFFYFNFGKLKFYKKEIFNTSVIFLILFIGIFIFKSHDDFAYYHFPYTLYLIEQKIIIGLGQILQGFRTPSSIFYFNSLTFLPFADYYLFNFFPVYILGFSNLILVKNIFKKNINFINYLILLSFIFINIFFYRFAEHGTDRSAQILIFILAIEILNQINNLKINK